MNDFNQNPNRRGGDYEQSSYSNGANKASNHVWSFMLAMLNQSSTILLLGMLGALFVCGVVEYLYYSEITFGKIQNGMVRTAASIGIAFLLQFVRLATSLHAGNLFKNHKEGAGYLSLTWSILLTGFCFYECTLIAGTISADNSAFSITVFNLVALALEFFFALQFKK